MPHEFLTLLVKIKHRSPFVRFKPQLVYVASLEQIHVEVTDEYIESYAGAGGRYLFCMRSGASLCYDVQS